MLGPAVVAQHGWAQGEVSRILEPAWSLTESLDHRPPMSRSCIRCGCTICVWIDWPCRSSRRRRCSPPGPPQAMTASRSWATGRRSDRTSGWVISSRARREMPCGDVRSAASLAYRRAHQHRPADPTASIAGNTLDAGLPRPGARSERRKGRHARQRNHPFDLGFALTIGAQVFDYLGEPEELLRQD